MAGQNRGQDILPIVMNRLAAIEKTSEQQRQVLEAIWETLLTVKDLSLKTFLAELSKEQTNPFNKFGRKCFSQTDEDGITLEIIRRLKIENGFFAEFGVGNGFENNTLVLVALGWNGFWVGNQDLEFNYSPSRKFVFVKEWLTRENISQLTRNILSKSKTQSIDVISLDLDGNDIHLVRSLLDNKFFPKLFIVEYNAKFPPPICFEIEYDPNHLWKGDDYYGASLCSYVEMFERFGYSLVC